MSAATTQLRIDRLSVSLAGRAIIEDVSVSLDGGQFVAVIGPNGSGKTTFLRALAGQMTITGTIAINGTTIERLSLPQKAKALSYLPQDMRQPIWPVPVRDIVALGLMPFDAQAAGDDPAVERQLQLWRREGLSPTIRQIGDAILAARANAQSAASQLDRTFLRIALTARKLAN